MRILVTSPVFPPDLGGPGIYVAHVARYLVERGHDVAVVAFCDDPHPRGHPFPVHVVRRSFLPLRYLRAFWTVLRRARGCDVVYVNEHLALLHVLAARIAGVPVVIRIMVDGVWEIGHRKGWIGGDDIVTFETKRYGFKVRLARALQKRWWGWSERIIACSEFLRRIPVERYGVPDSKVVRVFNSYNGPKRDEFALTREEARRELDLPLEPRYLLTICRLVVWKGVDGIVRALQGLEGDVQLLVAGDGDMLGEWTRLAAELGLADRVRFLGNVPHERIPLLIRAADVFVLNTEYEGLSHTLLEVSALGTPIVCTNVCGNPEVVEQGESGLLVPPKDPASLRAAIVTLLEDRALGQRLADEGVRRIERFERGVTYGEVERILSDVAGG